MPASSKGIVMSLVEGLAALLRGMATGELALALVAILAYSIAINGSYSSALRSGAASIAFAAAAGFTTLTPSAMSAVAFLALAVVGVAAFAALAWMLSSLLGLRDIGIATVESEPARIAPAQAQPVRAFAPQTSAMPL